MNEKSSCIILHVLRNDALGGLELSVLEIVCYFASLGINQHVVILSPLKSGISTRFTQAGISVSSIPFTKRKFISFAFKYWRLLHKLRPNVMLINGAFGLHALLALIARTAAVKSCWTYLIMGPPERGLPWLVQFVMGQLARLFTTGEISITEYLKSLFGKIMLLPASRVKVISHWRPLERIARLSDAARHNRSDPMAVILTVSRLDWVKDFPSMINAFAYFISFEPESRFDIVGDGALLPQLEEQVHRLGITDKVRFLGHRNDVPMLLGSSDIFLFATSPIEGLGLVMHEAMAAGTPVVCTDVGPCREVLGDGIGGILVPPHDPEALAQAMLMLWSNPARRAALAQQAREFVFQHYSMEACGGQLYDLLFSCALPPQRERKSLSRKIS